MPQAVVPVLTAILSAQGIKANLPTIADLLANQCVCVLCVVVVVYMEVYMLYYNSLAGYSVMCK